jgi:pyruvate-formate lyase-activating enzyme
LSCLDLVLLDIKSGDPETYRRATERDLAPTLRFAKRLAAMGKPMRCVLVLTNRAERATGWAYCLMAIPKIKII